MMYWDFELKFFLKSKIGQSIVYRSYLNIGESPSRLLLSSQMLFFIDLFKWYPVRVILEEGHAITYTTMFIFEETTRAMIAIEARRIFVCNDGLDSGSYLLFNALKYKL